MTVAIPASPQATLVREVIEAKMRLKKNHAHRHLHHLQQTLSIYIQRKAESAKRNRKTSFRFNPLRTIPIYEPTHSRVLGDLLDTHGSHGQGDLFLLEFLKRIGHGNPLPGIWHVTIETGRVDICLWRTEPASVVIIENKSNWAIDQQYQLYRYWYENIHRNYPELNYNDGAVRQNFKIVYMAPSEHKRPESHSLRRPPLLDGMKGLPDNLPLIPTPFTLDSDLTAWFAACIQQLDTENERLRHFLKLYQEIWAPTS
jgi:hypothetical protein